MHVVYNNTTNYQIAHVYIDGALEKLCHLFLCPSVNPNHNGDTILWGQDCKPDFSTNTVLSSVNYMYLKYVDYTMQPDDIMAEAYLLQTRMQNQITAAQKAAGCSAKAAKVN